MGIFLTLMWFLLKWLLSLLKSLLSPVISGSGRVHRALDAVERGEFQKAILLLQRRNSLAPYNLHLNLGICYKALENLLQARKHFKMAAEVETPFVQPHLWYIDVKDHTSLREYEADLLNIEREFPENHQVLYRLAELCFLQERYSEVLTLSNIILDEAPDDCETLELVFKTALSQENYSLAEEILSRLSALDPHTESHCREKLHIIRNFPSLPDSLESPESELPDR